MAHLEAAMSTKGQITIPAPVREALDLKKGDRVDFYLDAKTRTVRLRARNRSLKDLFGALDHAVLSGEVAFAPESMDDAVGAAVAADHERIMREAAEWQEFLAWKAKRAADAAE